MVLKFNNTPKFCINLQRRPDRKESVQKEFTRIGLHVNFWVATDKESLTVPPNSIKTGEFNAKAIYACMLSHRSIIRHCRNNRFDYAVIFEDDIRLCDDFMKRIHLIESSDIDFDMMYLGGHFNNDNSIKKTDNKYIFSCTTMAGTYGYIIKNTVFDFLLNNISENYGIDEFYGEIVLKKFKGYAFLPFLVDHVDGASDISWNKSGYPLTHKYYKQKL